MSNIYTYNRASLLLPQQIMGNHKGLLDIFFYLKLCPCGIFVKTLSERFFPKYFLSSFKCTFYASICVTKTVFPLSVIQRIKTFKYQCVFNCSWVRSDFLKLILEEKICTSATDYPCLYIMVHKIRDIKPACMEGQQKKLLALSVMWGCVPDSFLKVPRRGGKLFFLQLSLSSIAAEEQITSTCKFLSHRNVCS